MCDLQMVSPSSWLVFPFLKNVLQNKSFNFYEVKFSTFQKFYWSWFWCPVQQPSLTQGHKRHFLLKVLKLYALRVKQIYKIQIWVYFSKRQEVWTVGWRFCFFVLVLFLVFCIRWFNIFSIISWKDYLFFT